MADFTLNSQARVIARVKDVNQQLVVPSAVTITFTRPDLTTTSPAVTNDAAGIYHADVTLNQAGTWTCSGSSTGTVSVPVPLTFTVA
jgi:hypothetical protein